MTSTMLRVIIVAGHRVALEGDSVSKSGQHMSLAVAWGGQEDPGAPSGTVPASRVPNGVAESRLLGAVRCERGHTAR